MLSLLESAGNWVLQLDPESNSKLKQLQGKVICVDIEGIKKSFYLLAHENEFALDTNVDQQADVTIKGNPVAFASIAIQRTASMDFEKFGLQVSGDIELAQEFAALLQQLDIDWEEQLARVVGDFPARKIGNVLRHLSHWKQQASADFALNLGEYLQEERRDLANPGRVNQFINDVDELRADVDRIAKRIQRLTTKSSG